MSGAAENGYFFLGDPFDRPPNPEARLQGLSTREYAVNTIVEFMRQLRDPKQYPHHQNLGKSQNPFVESLINDEVLGDPRLLSADIISDVPVADMTTHLTSKGLKAVEITYITLSRQRGPTEAVIAEAKETPLHDTSRVPASFIQAHIIAYSDQIEEKIRAIGHR